MTLSVLHNHFGKQMQVLQCHASCLAAIAVMTTKVFVSNLTMKTLA